MLATHFNKSINNSLKGNIMYIYELDNGTYKGKYSKNICIILDLLSSFFENNNYGFLKVVSYLDKCQFHLKQDGISTEALENLAIS